ncbi:MULTISPECIES: patatin family protein [unclassified Rothia (in: high G+C Gram-positive bacteria)]|uniref:patatin-like phospholipase family protein n=1 Tax=unclassified Rothia (in: high G+C Gram-positive bacteria) TaxID=2689056 RepID=UPI00195E1D96|nr:MULTISPECIES: patatin-like phospholipase family protein [unclassified Rothia (in: high G+C Gram-positive bacteria)]MBM7051135.1 patatin-like phospholipase family protein [Rothia sp. ZJ1223]QRZ62166.1 patatin-like phospholipase family protein [Rothia sp. ZJ932]
MHPTLELMNARKRSGSLPLNRDDDSRLVLVLEGGSSRAAYGGGMVGVLEELGYLNVFDAVYGTSAGALNAAWFLCERANANMHGWWDPESMKAAIKISNFFRGKPVVDGDLLIDHVYVNVTEMGFEEVLSSPIEYHPIATDADTGENTDLASLIQDLNSLKRAMKSTARIPLLSGLPVELAERRFIDGGMTENVPIETALAQGATHVLVIRTKAPSTELATTNKYTQAVIARWLAKHAPGAVSAWEARNRRKQELEVLLQKESARVLQVAPPHDAPSISMTDSNPAILKQAVNIGKDAMRRALHEGTIHLK